MKRYRIDSLSELFFEHALRSIYGKRIRHGYSVSNLKKECKLMINTLKKSIDLNVETDGFHNSRIQLSLNKLSRALKQKDFEPLYIMGLVEIIFLLLGDNPRNWEEKVTNKPHNFKFDLCRKLFYSQSMVNKFNVICESHKYEPFCSQISVSKLREEYYKENGVYKINHKQFINWYKKRYGKNYLELF